MTHEQYKDTHAAGKQRTAAYQIKQACGLGYSKDALLTPEQVEALLTRFSPGAKKQRKEPRNVTRAKSVPQYPAIIFNGAQNTPNKVAQPETPQPKAQKGAEAQVLFYAPLFANAVSIALTIAGLRLFAGSYGFALGAMFGLMLLSAVVVSRNANKGDTSQTALKTVLYMECGACLLHVCTFYTVLPDVNMWMRGAAASLMAAGVAVLSYNAVLLVRNYNAE